MRPTEILSGKIKYLGKNLLGVFEIGDSSRIYDKDNYHVRYNHIKNCYFLLFI